MFALRTISVPGGGRYECDTVDAGEELPDTLSQEQLERLVRIGAAAGELPDTGGQPDPEDELLDGQAALLALFTEAAGIEDDEEAERVLREGLVAFGADTLRALAPEDVELPDGDDADAVVDALIAHYTDDESKEGAGGGEPDVPIDAAKAPKADLQAYVAKHELTVKGTGKNKAVTVGDLRKAVATHQAA